MGHNDPFKGKTVTAGWAYDLSRSTTYTPALTASTNPDLGADGTATGWRHRGGHLIIAGAFFEFSGSGLDAGSGTYIVSLPIAADTSLLTASGSWGGGSIVGHGLIRTNSSSDMQSVQCQLATGGDEVRLQLNGGQPVGHDQPAVGWVAEGSRITLEFAYPADPTAL